MKKITPKTQEEARQYAIDWQNWAGEQVMSWSEVLEWEEHFRPIAKKFDLIEEFKENGIC